MGIQEALNIINDLVTCEMEHSDDHDEYIVEQMQELQEAWNTIQLTINKEGL